AGADTGFLLDANYVNMFDWLDNNGEEDEVILAAPVVGLWVPARTGLRPVYGHEFETVPAGERLTQVRAFYRGLNCEAVLDPDLPFHVSYVVWGGREDRVGVVDSDEDDIDEIITNNIELSE